MRMSTFPAILSVAIFLSSYANAYRHGEVCGEGDAIGLGPDHVIIASAPQTRRLFISVGVPTSYQNEVYSREPHYVDTLSPEITARELLSELTTRELVDELDRRLNYICDFTECKGVSFGTDNMLMSHYRQRHNVGPCPRCDKSFPNGGLAHHMHSCRWHRGV
ncbi:hypothetical protein DFP72DRAFT_1050907 [Ephemerocybe angulata]|uniref:C2H2-type domain-containing protein n=1 Tax=Ephemerocybe angulata TaxID=980116 RepID=A0A8H6HH67_9AGAR|nr:hypothetical protein DFP72DRAFT_1050907 [Tulosesus angulatus]